MARFESQQCGPLVLRSVFELRSALTIPSSGHASPSFAGPRMPLMSNVRASFKQCFRAVAKAVTVHFIARWLVRVGSGRWRLRAMWRACAERAGFLALLGFPRLARFGRANYPALLQAAR